MSSNAEQIKEKLDIVDVISSYIKVEKAGINFKARCPFHNEKTPSFFISPSRQSFYCFGCGEKGDIFSFVEKFEGLDFRGALTNLANKAGIEITNIKDEKSGEEKEKLFEIMEEATKIFEFNLKQNKNALDYLKNRGLTDESISKWRIGFAKDEWRNLHDELIAKGFSKELLLSVGVLKKVLNEGDTQKIEKYYDTFRNRIMFPICDNLGRVIAFSGRSLNPDDKTPKYLNSPETKLFYKSEVLYGLHLAKNNIRKLDYAVLVEGQLDLVMSHQANVLNTVASSGTALTFLHLQKIQKISNRAIIAYDSDEAGHKASIKAGEMALSLGMETKIATLKEGEDPASVIKNDPKDWIEALKKSEHIIDFVLSKILKEKEGRNLTKEIINTVLPLVSLLKSDIEKSQFIRKIALKLGVKEDDVREDLNKIKLNRQNELENSNYTSPKMNSPTIGLERLLVSMIFLEESKNEGKEKKLKERWQKFTKENIDTILDKYREEKDSMVFEAEIYNDKNNIEKISEDILNRVEIQYLKNEFGRQMTLLDKKNISTEEEGEIKKQLEEIQNRIKQINY